MLWWEEYHVVATVEGHELETPKAEHPPGMKRLLKIVHLELNGKVLSTRSDPLESSLVSFGVWMTTQLKD
jgi:hypothetical protein